ncbi:carboxymuconolactone decarboxylase family protein [Mycobacterium sp. 4858]|uniref:carboxymuconolactone decarboxylase family protein n=1 Tax=Mycobacterium sp. 4858 TaxID=2057185 RepID=UPI0018EE1510|nr:carboxymuconolactone decarboxylase family protein [Mycobacterium sp. 4858]
MVTEIVTPRIDALDPPYEAAVAALLQKMMPPDVPPIALFRVVVRNMPMAEAMTRWGGYELSRALSLSLRDREIVIDRTCARCGCEYEWGVHVAFSRTRPASIARRSTP